MGKSKKEKKKERRYKVMTKMRPVGVLKSYFGFRVGQGIKDFVDELKELSTEEKLELARQTAEQLGVELDESPV